MKDDNVKVTKLELIINTAVPLVVIAVLLVLARSYWRSEAAPSQIAVGTEMAQNVNWHAKGTTMVFILSTTCHFCAESADFHRELSQFCEHHGISTLALFPQPVREARSYLHKAGIKVDNVQQASFSELGIQGTPTLLLIDASGKVKRLWVGWLTQDAERAVYGEARLLSAQFPASRQ
jgi:thioredoxin-related protein